jgi:hypothetical protein
VERGPAVALLLLTLVLPLATLFARRLPVRQGLVMALAWIAIFGVAIAAMKLAGFT